VAPGWWVTAGARRFWLGAVVLVLALAWGDRHAFPDGGRALRWALTQPHADTVQRALARYEPVRAFLRPAERLGFVSDAKSYSDWVFEFLTAQYTLAPAVLLRERAAKYALPLSVLRAIREAPAPGNLVGSFRGSPPAELMWRSTAYVLARDFGEGTALYARRK
jgi:hypothetical protein